MELKVDSNSMAKLLKFLTGGFNGGTDVDKPLELSLKRLAEKEWNQVRHRCSLDSLSLYVCVYCMDLFNMLGTNWGPTDRVQCI